MTCDVKLWRETWEGISAAWGTTGTSKLESLWDPVGVVQSHRSIALGHGGILSSAATHVSLTPISV